MMFVRVTCMHVVAVLLVCICEYGGHGYDVRVYVCNVDNIAIFSH